MRPTEETDRVVAFTVKKVRKGLLQAFGAACRYQGRTMQDVIAELMQEYSERVLGKLPKG